MVVAPVHFKTKGIRPKGAILMEFGGNGSLGEDPDSEPVKVIS
jgi:hypothetical protein